MKHEDDTATLEEYYGSLRELFNMAGWKTLCEDLSDSYKLINSVETAKDENDLYYRKGQLAVINNILNLSDQVKTLEDEFYNNSQED